MRANHNLVQELHSNSQLTATSRAFLIKAGGIRHDGISYYRVPLNGRKTYDVTRIA